MSFATRSSKQTSQHDFSLQSHTAQCIHNGFMSCFIWVLMLFYIPLNVGITLKHTVNLVILSCKLILFPIIWILRIHLYSLMQITEAHGPRGFSKDQQQGRTDYVRKWNPCWWLPAYGFIRQPSLPAWLESNSVLPKLSRSICASHEEEVKGPESWLMYGKF